MAMTTIRNGVDVDRLVQTIDAINGDATVAGFTFRSTTTWVEGDLDLRNFVGIEQGPRPGFTRSGFGPGSRPATPARSNSTSCAATCRRPPRWETSSPTRYPARSRSRSADLTFRDGWRGPALLRAILWSQPYMRDGDF
jgi:hypothetical protein